MLPAFVSVDYHFFDFVHGLVSDMVSNAYIIAPFPDNALKYSVGHDYAATKQHGFLML